MGSFGAYKNKEDIVKAVSIRVEPRK